jgi:uridylate kinase
MKVVVSVGGSVFVPTVSAEYVRDHAAVVEELADEGRTMGVVVGGGTTAREYIGVARDLGANEMVLDELGIAATRLNARLLTAALDTSATPSPPEDYETAGAAMRRGDVPVMGGVAPAQTTDAVAAALAEYTDADLLVYATSVSGVFDADPDETDDARKFDRLTPGELVDVIADLERTAGAAAPVDLVAAKVIERAGLRTVVLDGTDPGRVADAVRRGDHDGTDVVPDGETGEPTYWAAES